MKQSSNQTKAKIQADKLLPGRPVSASRTEMTELVLPQDSNLLGNILGGRVMHLIDIAGAIAAHRHCHRQVVTASVDHLDFLNPVRVGDLIVLEAQVNRAFHTSVEVGVEVFSEDSVAGVRKHTTTAFLTFVALDEIGKPVPVPPLIVKTSEERRRYREAGERRNLRLKARKKIRGRNVGSRLSLLPLFSVPSVFSVLKDFTVCESRKNSKAFNTENTEGTEKTKPRLTIPRSTTHR